MTQFRLGRAAELVGVSVDRIRRWANAGELPTSRTEGGHRVIEGADLARFCQERAHDLATEGQAQLSARNRFTGLVTKVTADKVVAQVEIQAGPHRIVSLMTREAVEDLGLRPGVVAVAAVKSTNVVVEIPDA